MVGEDMVEGKEDKAQLEPRRRLESIHFASIHVALLTFSSCAVFQVYQFVPVV